MSDHETKEIEPALTAEEWRELNINGMHAGSRDGEPLIFATCEYCDFPPLKVMALANAALPDDDPRKITREDVDLLRLLLRAFAPDDKVRDWLPALAAKLAVLLPPE